MGIVDQAVEDAVGDGGITDLLVPMIYGELTGDDGGGMAMPFLDNLQKVSAFCVCHGGQAEIVNHQDMGLGKFADDFSIASIAFGKVHLIGELGGTNIEGTVSFPAGLFGQGAGQEGFPHACESGDDDVLMTFDPIAGDEAHHDGLK